MTESSASSSKPRTIALVVQSFGDSGGVGSVAEFILRAIERRPDFHARLISLSTWAQDPCSLLLSRPSTWLRGVTSEVRTKHGLDFVHVGARFGEIEFQRLAPRPELSCLLQDCDLIQVVAGVPSWATPVFGLGKPVALQVATLATVERRARARIESGPLALWRAAMTGIVARLDEAALRRADAVMVENGWMRDYAQAAITETGGGGQVAYAPPGVDTNIFHPRGDDEPLPERPYILAVGRFSDLRKNPRLLLEAYALLAKLRVDVPDLILAGADSPGPDFTARAKALGLVERIHVKIGLDQPSLAALFRNATCLALPSDEEGFGVVVIEAMASGVPVVATRCGGPEDIITDGLDGYLVDRDDAEAMADRLQRFIADPVATRAMGARARATVEARFSDKVAGDAFLDLYDRMLGLNPAGTSVR